MRSTYEWALETENESLRQQVKELKKRIRKTIDAAVAWVDENVGSNQAPVVRGLLEDLEED